MHNIYHLKTQKIAERFKWCGMKDRTVVAYGCRKTKKRKCDMEDKRLWLMAAFLPTLVRYLKKNNLLWLALSAYFKCFKLYSKIFSIAKNIDFGGVFNWINRTKIILIFPYFFLLSLAFKASSCRRDRDFQQVPEDNPNNIPVSGVFKYREFQDRVWGFYQLGNSGVIISLPWKINFMPWIYRIVIILLLIIQTFP